MKPKIFQPEVILIVDDIAKNIQLAGKAISNAGYETVFARNGHSALQLLKKHKIDLILLDIMMPELSGIEICKIIKNDQNSKEIPIIFLTAKNETNDIKEAFAAGGVDYITKPFNIEELLVRVNNQIQIQRQKNELRELNNSKDRFFSIIAHDLKNPFQGIAMLSKMIISDYEKLARDEVFSYLAQISDATDHTYDLLINLLDWARSQKQEINIFLEYLDINNLIESTYNLLKPLANKKKLLIEVKHCHDCFIIADKNMISTAFRNILSNAIKFSPINSKISISVNKTDNWIFLSVTDNGIGIPDYDKNTLFDFNKKHIAKGTIGETGTGLGLVISKDFVERNLGHIYVEDAPPSGAVFIIKLPAAEKTQANEMLAPPPTLPQSYATSQDPNTPGHLERKSLSQPLNILLAEDQVINQTIAKRTLGLHGHKIDLATTGRQAVEKFSAKVYDVVLMDLGLPELDGIQATIEIRKIEKKRKQRPIPIIAMTAYDLLDTDQEKNIPELSGFTSKPLDYNDFVNVYMKTIS